MRIGFFTYGMKAHLTGIGRYAVELTRALRSLEPQAEIVLINPYPDSKLDWYREFPTIAVPQLARLPAVVSIGHVLLHRIAVAWRLDILHDPCGIAPFLVPTRSYRRVTTVHDLVPIIWPEVQPLATRLIFRTLIPAARYTADAIFTVSQASASDLQRMLNVPPKKLFVTPNGVTPPQPITDLQVNMVLDRLGIQKPFFLYVGAINRRKNLDRVYEAFGQLRVRFPDLKLIIVGPSSWGGAGIAQRAKVDPNIILTGFLSDHELQALYRSCVALVYVSLYEGFGLPVLEALAQGAIVIASNVSALPEVVGEAGLLVDPLNPQEIHDAMHALLCDPDKRRNLRSKAPDQVAKFTWRRTAESTLAAYYQILQPG